jgi:hypothetical protein
VLKAQTPNLEVAQDGVNIDIAAVGTALPIDPGAHQVQARASGYKSWTTTVEAKERAVVDVEIPGLEPSAAAVLAPATTPLSDTERTVASAPAARAVESSGGGVRTAGFITIGVGAAALAAGAVTGVLAVQSDNRSKELCPAVRCANREGADAASRAQSLGTVSTIALIGGGVLAAGGFAMVLLGKPASRTQGQNTAPRPASVRLTAGPSLTSFSTSIFGEF